jgi:hypothetical protein
MSGQGGGQQACRIAGAERAVDDRAKIRAQPQKRRGGGVGGQ